MVKRLTNPFVGGPTPLGTLLTAAGRRISGELDAALRTAGFTDVRAAHAPLFMAIEADGCSVTTLAERTRMTKQAVGELIRHLAERGYLQVAPDPDDKRVRRVTLTTRGWQVVEAGQRVVADFDAWLAAEVGADRVQQLRETLTMIADTEPAER
ncbi:MarR family winged helix-turn-helix transcriptional regulator [Enemella evansiae]|uniref:MarR family transcriptional regulator n=1 Tax=Enemella evansiae TaxID=2016499 RepID=A0A255FYN0_9ACTN|nr:MarR family transcriptional regulator [Enemella evansiae]OYO07279.1 MarR family transcriptional regulator [Enemella evansiae]OYO08790.1 MarR family transcriptional regulator [Enemella evansiae]OYO11291.1 MarR family transcriptional regulator [Enemella evansiae]TDO87910.1 MarR family transcriptional regulator [Enemella evansiae]